jgi:hypothetical protein
MSNPIKTGVQYTTRNGSTVTCESVKSDSKYAKMKILKGGLGSSAKIDGGAVGDTYWVVNNPDSARHGMYNCELADSSYEGRKLDVTSVKTEEKSVAKVEEKPVAKKADATAPITEEEKVEEKESSVGLAILIIFILSIIAYFVGANRHDIKAKAEEFFGIKPEPKPEAKPPVEAAAPAVTAAPADVVVKQDAAPAVQE